jgi:hypothetical protein
MAVSAHMYELPRRWRGTPVSNWGHPLVDWGTIAEKLVDGSPPDPDAHNARTTWLTTLNDDGRPHVTAVGAL